MRALRWRLLLHEQRTTAAPRSQRLTTRTPSSHNWDRKKWAALHPRVTAISFAAGTLNCSAALAMASASSFASISPIQMALRAARWLAGQCSLLTVIFKKSLWQCSESVNHWLTTD